MIENVFINFDLFINDEIKDFTIDKTIITKFVTIDEIFIKEFLTINKTRDVTTTKKILDLINFKILI